MRYARCRIDNVNTMQIRRAGVQTHQLHNHERDYANKESSYVCIGLLLRDCYEYRLLKYLPYLFCVNEVVKRNIL